MHQKGLERHAESVRQNLTALKSLIAERYPDQETEIVGVVEALAAAVEKLGLASGERPGEADSRAFPPAVQWDRVHAILESTPTQLAYLDPQFNFVLVNSAYAAGAGYKTEDLIGRNHFALFPHAENQAIFERVRDTGEPVSFEAKPFEHPREQQRETTYWDWTLRPIKNKRGEVEGLVLSLLDVTDRIIARQGLQWELAVNEAVAEVSNALIAPAATMQEIAEVVLDCSRRLTNSPYGYVSPRDPRTGDLVSYTLTKMMGKECRVSPEHRTIRFPIGPDGRYPGLWGHALNTKTAFYTNAPDTHEASKGLPPGHVPLTSFLSVPAVIGGTLMGQIVLANAPQGYTDRQLEAIQRLAALYALALQRKYSEEAQQQERDFIAAVLETAGALVAVIDPEGRIVRFNSACELTTGYSVEEVTGKCFWDLFLVPDEVEPVKAVFESLRAGQFPNAHENYWLTKDGRRRLIAWSNTALLDSRGAVEYVIGTGIDITERRLAERELQWELAVSRAAVELSNALITPSLSVGDIASLVLHCARRLTNSEHGYVSEVDPKTGDSIAHTLTKMMEGQCTVSGEQRKIVFSPEPDGRYPKLWGEALNTGKGFYTNSPGERETSTGVPAGHIPLRNFLSVPAIIDARLVGQIALANCPRGYVDRELGAVERLAKLYALALQRKRSEEAVKRERDNLIDIFDSMEDGVYIINQSYDILYVNPALQKTFGPPKGMKCHQYFDNQREVCPWCKSREVFSGKTVRWEWHSSKTQRTYDLISTPIANPDGRLSNLVIFRDITERKQMEEALRKSQRELAVRNRIAEVFLTVPDDEVYGGVLQVILEAAESPHGLFGYIHENGSLVLPSLTRDIWDKCQVPDKNIVFPRECWAGLWGWALLEKQTRLSNRPLQVPQGHIPLSRAVSVPIVQSGELRGIITVANKPTDYEQKDVELLESIAAHIAPILDARLQRDRHYRARKQAERSLISLRRRLKAEQSFAGIIGRDPKMLDLFETIREVAASDVPVLIQGESGTGKELVATAIHKEGPRRDRPFIPVSCSALPATLLETELFGHVRGAFSGAIRDKKGRFELADGGTIFLDEVGELTPAIQIGLLRVLQEGTFERVGAEKSTKVDVRIISATNKNLAKEVAAGRFREDLFYRLCVIPIHLPALRERRGDIPLLATHILLREVGEKDVVISEEAMGALLEHDWPGNVRELQNAIHYASVKSKENVLELRHFPPTISARPEAMPRAVRRGRKPKLDARAVARALEQAHGNKKEAARRLGVSRATLYRFLGEGASAEP